MALFNKILAQVAHMAKSFDYSKLRERALVSSQDEEAVTVNTRALIDKILARYSAEWCTLRELIQNAADANATTVTIRYETRPSPNVPLPSTNDSAALLKHTLLHLKLSRLVVTNNGDPFGENDWARLKRIAEGNPNEEKIGAFGVGFYSVFDECESPFVTSGSDSMAFYWKGNSLFTRRSTLPDDAQSPDTSFVLDYRSENTPVFDLMSLCKFLSTSLAFIALENIQLYLDGWNIFTLQKKLAPTVPISVPGDIQVHTDTRRVRIDAVDAQRAQIDVSWLNIVGWTPTHEAAASRSEGDAPARQNTTEGPLRSFFSRLAGSVQNPAAQKAAKEEETLQQAITEDALGMSTANVFVQIANAFLKTNVGPSFARELERATKKPPPKKTKISLLTSSLEEMSATMSTLSGTASKKGSDIVASIVPKKNGKIFIGFPTHQTTGFLAHVSAPSLIPTVERTNIDLNSQFPHEWNMDLLQLAGIACRIAYTMEMFSVRDRLNAAEKHDNGQPKASAIDEVVPSANHIMSQFTFRDTTPLARAGQLVENGFWECQKHNSIHLLSSLGVLPSKQVRTTTEDLSFVQGIPVLPEKTLKEAAAFVAKLQDIGMIREIMIADIRRELDRQALSEAQLREFLRWVANKCLREKMDTDTVKHLFQGTVVDLSESEGAESTSQVLPLGHVKFFVNSSRIPPDAPIPPDTMPFCITKSLSPMDMNAFGWSELPLVSWVTWLVDAAQRKTLPADKNITTSDSFASQVLRSVSRSFDSLASPAKTSIVEVLYDKTIIPTKFGLRKPCDSYFASVRLFDDLPTVSNHLQGVKESFLKALGVRKTIELKVIFDRLMSSESNKQAGGQQDKWNHVDLIKYLISVWSDIPEQDINQLRKTALCPAEKKRDPLQGTAQRYRVAELYEPKESLRELSLPVLQWPGQFNAYSHHGKFLRMLGLQACPAAEDMVELLAKAHRNLDTGVYEAGLRYFIENHYQNEYATFNFSALKIAFVPVDGTEKRRVVKPDDCFTNPAAKVLGFDILRRDLAPNATKFGVKADPPIQDCAMRLIRAPPKTNSEAQKLFSYFTSRLNDMPTNTADRLGASGIVPIESRSKSGSTRLVTPKSCFLGDGAEYGDIFDYVDFGQEANVFLLKVGSKHEPSSQALTRIIIQEPARISKALGVEKYLGLLRKLQVETETLKRDRSLWKEMKASAFLLGCSERPSNDARDRSNSNADLDPDDEDAEATVKEWDLASGKQIVVVDDLLTYTLFKEHLLAAPQEETLEEMYVALGSPKVSSMVHTTHKYGNIAQNQRPAKQIRELVLERSRLFLHEQPSNAILHDTKWLEKSLGVQVVESLSLIRTLKDTPISHRQKRTASLTDTGLRGAKAATLSVTTDCEMWQVAEALVPLMVHRSKPQTTLVLEMFLTTDLRKLQLRGYNVNRILQKHDAEKARLAESDRKKRQEEERKQVEEMARQQRQLEQQKQLESPPNSPNGLHLGINNGAEEKQSMPGSFHDSPEAAQNTNKQAKPKGLLSTLSNAFGLDDSKKTSKHGQQQGLLGSRRSSEQMKRRSSEQVKRQSSEMIKRQSSDQTRRNDTLSLPPVPVSTTSYNPNQLKSTKQTEAVTNPTKVDNNLERALQATRAHNSHELFSRPQTDQVKEVSSYCDTKPGHSLVQAGRTSSGNLQVYLSRGEITINPVDFMHNNASGLEQFSAILTSIWTQIFELQLDTLHIFCDESGASIAFNSNGAIFCNYRYFAQLHLQGINANSGRETAVHYWYMTLCHELAHNLVADHSSNHSYYTEQMAASRGPRLVRLLSGMLWNFE